MDGQGNIVVGGSTTNDDFPVYNAMQSQRLGNKSGALVKLDSGGTRVWATFFGGGFGGYANIMVVGTDRTGNIIGAGWRANDYTGFPLLNAWQDTVRMFPTREAPFFFKMSSAGALLHSSFFVENGGVSVGNGAVDGEGNLVFVCQVSGGSLPMMNAFQTSRTTSAVVFINNNGQPRWSTYLGGYQNGLTEVRDAAFDRQGNVVIVGHTSAPDFPVQRAWQTQKLGSNDMFITKFTPYGGLIWSTFYGGSGIESALGVACDSLGGIYVAGYSGGPDFPVHYAAYPQKPSINKDSGIVAKFDSSGVRNWATWLGGGEQDRALAVTPDRRGYVYVVGETQSSNFPVFSALQSSIAGIRNNLNNTYHADVFITRIGYNGYIPVTLSRLSAQRVSGGVELTWRTESEVNAYGFIIERRYERESATVNNGWHDIGFVPSAAQGNEGGDYIYLDPGTADMRIFYRLRMVDLDGTFEHSPVVEVGTDHSVAIVSFEAAYPAPAREWLTLNFSLPEESVVNLAVYDVSGREIVRVSDGMTLFAGAHSIVLPVGEWRSGLYLCRLEACGTRIVRKVMVVR